MGWWILLGIFTLTSLYGYITQGLIVHLIVIVAVIAIVSIVIMKRENIEIEWKPWMTGLGVICWTFGFSCAVLSLFHASLFEIIRYTLQSIGDFFSK